MEVDTGAAVSLVLEQLAALKWLLVDILRRVNYSDWTSESVYWLTKIHLNFNLMNQA